MKNWDEIGQMLVSGALDDTKKMRKAGADIFAKSGLEKAWKKQGTSRRQFRFFPIFMGFFQAQILRKYPRQPSASFWYHLELQRPTLDQMS